MSETVSRSATPLSATAPGPRRRTQSERSDAMRVRLLKATLQCLAEEGYAATTLSAVVRRAGVSRGAQVHHYPNKQALLMDAAEYLLRQTYRDLGELLLSVADEDDRLQALVEAVWERLFSTALFRAYFELIIASQHDAELAQALHDLLLRTARLCEPASKHYFEMAPEAGCDAIMLFMQLYSLCLGLAAQAHLLKDPAYVQRHLRLWLHQVAALIRARKGVEGPPPRPPSWD